MKRCMFILMLFLVSSNLCLSQEWLTSLDVAKRVALVQDKFLFMIWEEASLIPYPVIMNDEKDNLILFDNLFENEEINQLIWKNFVPVKVNEALYSELYDQIKNTKSQSYIAQFEDDNIKIMDANFNIVSTSISPEAYFNLSKFMNIYALNTSFLNTDLRNYSEHKNFNTTLRLASKYMDYAILVGEKAREDIVNLADRYLDEADRYLLQSDLDNKLTFQRKIDLMRLSKYLILNRPKKVIRTLKKFDKSELDETNESLINFLYYTSYRLLKDDKKAQQWLDKVSTLNLKKAELITKIHF